MRGGSVSGRLAIWAGLAFVGVVMASGCEEDPRLPAGVGPGAGPGPTSTTSTGGSGGDTGGAGTGGASSAGGGGAMPVTEDCFDGEDNDLDGLNDCLGDDECDTVCDDPCAAPKVLSDPGNYGGDTTGFAVIDGTSCVATVGGGPTSVFAVTAAHTGVLEVFLNGSSADFTLSARTTCGDAASEIGCSEFVDTPALDEQLALPVTQGDTVYILVQGKSAVESGSYTLVVQSHAVTCGDGKVDPPEECDDGNTDPDDGCDACVFVPTEVEPNNTFPTATAWTDPTFGSIDPLGDIDVFTVTIPGDDYSIIASTFDLGNGACAQNKLDSQIFIALPDTTVLGSDNNSGDGLCARASARNLSAGTIYVRVQAPGGNQSTFPYRLALEIDQCGNGTIGAAEECDDGNTDSGDGCSASCLTE